MASVPTGGCDGGVRRPPPGQAGGGGGQRHQAPRAHLLRAAVRRAPENRTRARPQVLQETGEAVGGGSVPVVRTHWFTSRSAASASRPTRRPLAGPLGLPPGSSGGGARGQQGRECTSVAAPWPSARWLQGPRAACPQPLRALLTTAGASGLGGAGEDTWGSAGSRGPFSTGVTSAWSVRQCRGEDRRGQGAPQCTQEVTTCAQVRPPPACGGRGSRQPEAPHPPVATAVTLVSVSLVDRPSHPARRSPAVRWPLPVPCTSLSVRSPRCTARPGCRASP